MSGKRLIGLVCTNYNRGGFGVLTKERPVASLPFAGRYRLVDFPLSNMVNSGISTVGLITPYMYRSLMDHVGVGKEWALSRKEGGMFILPGSIYGYKLNYGHFRLRDVIRNKAFFQRAGGERTVVAVSSAGKVFNMDYREALEAHTASGSEITLICKRMDGAGLRADTNAAGRVVSLAEQDSGGFLFLDSFLIDNSLLLQLMEWYDAMGHLDLTELIQNDIGNLKVGMYEFPGYVAAVDDAVSYMRANMDVLHYSVRRELFMSQRMIRTKVQDSPPAKYLDGAKVANSVIASGCRIWGTVENSVIFRGVTVEKGAFVRNSVVMQNCVVCEGAVLERVILDKFAEVSAGVSLVGDTAHPVVLEKYARI